MYLIAAGVCIFISFAFFAGGGVIVILSGIISKYTCKQPQYSSGYCNPV